MPPKQVMTSVTHNSTAESSNKPKKGLWRRIRGAKSADVNVPSSEQIEHACSQIYNPLARSYVARKNSSERDRSVSQSFTSSRERDNYSNNEHRKRQQELLQLQHQMLREQQLHKQQHHQQYDQRKNEYIDQYKNAPSRNRRTDRKHHQLRNSDTSAAKALANLSMGNHRQTSPRRRGSSSSGTEQQRRRSSKFSEDSNMFNEVDGHEINYKDAEQPPPPYTVNKSSISSTNDYDKPVPSTQSFPQSYDINRSGVSNNMSSSQIHRNTQDVQYNISSVKECSQSYQNTIFGMYGSGDDPTVGPLDASICNTIASSLSNETKTRDYDSKSVPTGEVTIVYTDIQGAASLWEMFPDDMIEAHDVYDIIVRRCCAEHNGYEIDFSKSSFNLAFQNPIDALAFALEAQVKLYNSASWPDGIANHKDAKCEPALKFHGLRVRIGMSHGPVETRPLTSNGRPQYYGETVETAKVIGNLCHGGQILTTFEMWNMVSEIVIRNRCLGSPQCVDCGEHFLFETNLLNERLSDKNTSKKVCKRLIQLLPSELAFDFGASRGRVENDSSVVIAKNASSAFGRLFPPVISKKQLSTSFLNAPYRNGKVTLCTVQLVGVDELSPSSRSHSIKVLSKFMKKHLLRIDPPGYDSNDSGTTWTFAFDRMMSGVTFGLQLMTNLHEISISESVDKKRVFKVGIVSGGFSSMSVSVMIDILYRIFCVISFRN